MGNFRVTLNAVGGHGCQRELKDGSFVGLCGQDSCPDCITREYVSKMKAVCCPVHDATLEHWPGTPSQVTDHLLSGIRSGQF